MQKLTSQPLLQQAEHFRKRLEARTITLREVAQALDCNETYLSRVLSPTLNRVKSSSDLRKEASEVRKYRAELRNKHASLVKLRAKSLKKAAADAKCSERTMRRYVAKV